MKLRILAAALLAPAFAAHAVEPGNWELSLVTLMSGQAQPVAATQTRCFTSEDARDPGRMLPLGGTCEFTNRNETGGSFTFDIACTGLLPMKGKGRVEYTAQTMDADLDLTAGEGFGMRTRVKGRRLGPC